MDVEAGRTRPSLTELAVRYGTDKWGVHRYTPHYERYLSHLRDEAFTLIEIGIGGYDEEGGGGASLRMWREYFPHAQVVGLDIEDKSFLDGERLRTVQGDQSDPAVLDALLASCDDVRVVIDDGSHVPAHVRATFTHLFPRLDDGVIYIVEDLQTSYWPEWGGAADVHDRGTSMALVKDLVDGLNWEERVDVGRTPTYTDLHVTGVHAHHNMVMVEKGSNVEGTNKHVALSHRYGSTPTTPRVSIVVPTYCTGDALDGVVTSLDGLSLRRDELEVVFVDDGSPDDTYARLLGIATDRPWVRVERIEASGWPSRPRNVGVSLARGTYVLFMDHDDVLHPDGLRRALDFAEASGADVINAKETRSRGLTWGWDTWQDDLVVPRDSLAPLHLMPMTPHKLYRTEFLREHDISFREGGRVMWEDILFNLTAYAHARTVAVWSSSPVYEWKLFTGSNSSSSFALEVDEWWDAMDAVLAHVASLPLDPEDAAWFLRHQYTGRILHAMLGPSLEAHPEEFREASRARGLDVVQRRIPVDLDASLPPVSAARAQLLRAGDFATLTALGRLDTGIDVVPTASRVAWDGRDLLVESSVVWTHGEGTPMPFARRGDQLVRALPGVDHLLDDAALVVDAALAEATLSLGARDRDTHAAYPLPGGGTTTTAPLEGTAFEQVVGTVAGRVPLDAVGVMPGALGGTWDVSARATFMGATSHRPIQYDGPPAVALVDGALAVAYSSRAGNLAVDTGERSRSLLGVLKVDSARTGVEPGPSGDVHVVLPLLDVHVVGSTRRVVEVVATPAGDDGVERSVAGELVADEAGARVEAALALEPGAYDLALRVGDRTRQARVRLHVHRRRRPRVEVAPARRVSRAG